MKPTPFCIAVEVGIDTRHLSETFGQPACIYEVYRGRRPPSVVRQILLPMTSRRVAAFWEKAEAQAWIDRYHACERYADQAGSIMT